MRPVYKQRPPIRIQQRPVPNSSTSVDQTLPPHDPWTPKERSNSEPGSNGPSIQCPVSIPRELTPPDETELAVVERSPNDLVYSLEAYDGTPIILVPPAYFNVVAESLKAGLYGLDTESDCTTNELRIIQIYTRKEVYIFPASVLDDFQDNFFIKFLRAKDRIKIGVDIDNDIFVMRRHVHRRRVSSREAHLKNKFAVNGAIDIQSIARTVDEPLLSLDKLASKYVEDFKGNPSNLGSYNPPTNEQYIYAANDAIVSLKIYDPLRTKSPAKRWMIENGIDPSPPPVKLHFQPRLRTSRAVDRDPTVFEEAARAIIEEEDARLKALETQEEKNTDESTSESKDSKDETAEDDKSSEPNKPAEPAKNPKKRRNKRNKSRSPAEPDEIDRIVRSLSPIPAQPRIERCPARSVSPELQRKFKEKLASLRKNRGSRSTGKSAVQRERDDTQALLDEIESVREQTEKELKKATSCVAETKAQTNELIRDRRFIFYDSEAKKSRSVFLKETDLNVSGDYKTLPRDSQDLIWATEKLLNLKKTTLKGGPEAEKLARDIVPENQGNSVMMLDAAIERMIELNKEFGEGDFYECMGKLNIWFAGYNDAPKSYNDVLLFILGIPTIAAHYDRSDAILVSNIFINMAVDNNYLILEGDKLRPVI